MTVISVRSLPSGGSSMGVPHAPALYEAKPRRDGCLTWRRVNRPLLNTMRNRAGREVEVGVWTEAKAARLGEDLAQEMGIPFVQGVRHGTPVSQIQA